MSIYFIADFILSFFDSRFEPKMASGDAGISNGSVKTGAEEEMIIKEGYLVKQGTNLYMFFCMHFRAC